MEFIGADIREVRTMSNEQDNSMDEWSRLPDKPGVYPLAHIYNALRKDPYVNLEAVYGTAMKKAIAAYLKAHDTYADVPSEENRYAIQQAWKDVVDALNVTLFLINPDTETHCAISRQQLGIQ